MTCMPHNGSVFDFIENNDVSRIINIISSSKRASRSSYTSNSKRQVTQELSIISDVRQQASSGWISIIPSLTDTITIPWSSVTRRHRRPRTLHQKRQHSVILEVYLLHDQSRSSPSTSRSLRAHAAVTVVVFVPRLQLRQILLVIREYPALIWLLLRCSTDLFSSRLATARLLDKRSWFTYPTPRINFSISYLDFPFVNWSVKFDSRDASVLELYFVTVPTSSSFLHLSISFPRLPSSLSRRRRHFTSFQVSISQVTVTTPVRFRPVFFHILHLPYTTFVMLEHGSCVAYCMTVLSILKWFSVVTKLLKVVALPVSIYHFFPPVCPSVSCIRVVKTGQQRLISITNERKSQLQTKETHIQEVYGNGRPHVPSIE